MNILTKVQEYKNLREKSKAIKYQMDKLAKEIKESAMKNIVEDDKGNHLKSEDGLYFGARAVNRISYDIEVAEKKLSPEVFSNIVEVSKKIDQAKLELALKNGLVTEDEVLSFMNNKVSYSVVVDEVKKEKEKEEKKLKIKVKPFIKK